MGSIPNVNVVDLKLPNTPEAQLSSALRIAWYSRKAFKALDAFLENPPEVQRETFKNFPPQTLATLQAAMLNLERISAKFNKLCANQPKAANEVISSAAKPVTKQAPPVREKKEEVLPRVIPRATPTSRSQLSEAVIEQYIERSNKDEDRNSAPTQKSFAVLPADLSRARHILMKMFPKPDVVFLDKQKLAAILQESPETVEKSALWALRVAKKYWRSPALGESDPASPFQKYITGLRLSFSTISGVDPALFPGFLEILRRKSASSRSAINLNELELTV